LLEPPLTHRGWPQAPERTGWSMELRCAQFEFLVQLIEEVLAVDARVDGIEGWDRDRLALVDLTPEQFPIGVMRRIACHSCKERMRDGQRGRRPKLTQEGVMGRRMTAVRRGD
jgi:hypothetical protein